MEGVGGSCRITEELEAAHSDSRHTGSTHFINLILRKYFVDFSKR